MFNSLRVRLLLTFVIVVSVAVGTVAIFASHSTTSEFRRSVEVILDYPNFNLDSKINVINKYLDQHKGERQIWDEIQILFDRMGKTNRTRFVMADLYGNVLADSTGQLSGLKIDTTRSKPFAAFLIEGKPVLTYQVPLQDGSLESIESHFTTSVNRSLIVAIGAAGLVALLLTLLLSRSMLRPIDALTTAARSMEKGDLSQRVTVQSGGELGELAKAFNAMADGLARMERLRRNMVTDVAHELRTPLSNLRGYLEALLDGFIDPSPEIIASLHEEAMLLNRLVDDLQDLALAEAGQLNLVPQRIGIEEVVEKAVYPMVPQANEKGLRVEVDLPPGLPEVYVDAGRTVQVLRNLLTNAITNTQPGGEIRLSARTIDSLVEISVKDSGMGIAPEHHERIFGLFNKLDATSEGTGVGLALVKRIIEFHGGSIWVERWPYLSLTRLKKSTSISSMEVGILSRCRAAMAWRACSSR